MWTKDRPTKDGNYLWRVDEFDNEPDRIEIKKGVAINRSTGSRRFIAGGEWSEDKTEK